MNIKITIIGTVPDELTIEWGKEDNEDRATDDRSEAPAKKTLPSDNTSREGCDIRMQGVRDERCDHPITDSTYSTMQVCTPYDLLRRADSAKGGKCEGRDTGSCYACNAGCLE